MSFPLLRGPRAAACALVLAIAGHGLPAAAADDSAQMVGGIDAVVFVCGPIDAKSAKTGQALLERFVAERKLDLKQLRQAPGYQPIYNSEVNRMLSLSPKDKLAACQSAW